MFPVPLFIQPFINYCKGFYETHGLTGVLATLMGLYVLALALMSMLGVK